MKPLSKTTLAACVVILLTAALCTPGIAARRHRATRTGLHPANQEAAAEPADSFVTMTPADGDITLSGYDKPLRSSVESMFVTNHTSDTLTALRLDCTYTDLRGRELHTRSVDADIELLPGATRQITFPSWDRQHSFYYHRSQKPRRAAAAPYDFKCRVTSITVR